MRFNKIALLAVVLCAGGARAALTIDTTTCASGTVTNCPKQHMFHAVTGATGTDACSNANPSTCTFPNSYGVAGSGTLLIALVSSENHSGGSTSTISSMTAGTPARFSTAWTLWTKAESVNGASAIFYAVTNTSFSGEVDTITVGCSGGTGCGGPTFSSELSVSIVGFSSSFPLPGNTNANTSTGAAPSVTLTASAGDKLLFTSFDPSGANCTATPSPATATVLDTYQVVSGASCAAGDSDFFAASITTSTTSAGSATIGFSETGSRAWSGVEVCDSTATACPNSAAAAASNWMLMGVGN